MLNRLFRFACYSCVLLLVSSSCLARAGTTNESWRGVHLWLDNDADARTLIDILPALSADGVNAIILETDYSFEFQRHPELRNPRFVKLATAHALAAAARTNRIRLIPEFNCLGHQTFGHKISPLLRLHPEFNETPSLSIANTNVYCLEWCPRAPGLNEIIFSLIDDTADAIEADAVHVGMDEVYLLGADECPRCRGVNPARLYAAQVNALHAHIVDGKRLQMFMWADRVIGPKFQGYSRYDNDRNDLSAAIDLIPKDIVMCDWHYEWKKEYPSVHLLASKGFRVWPAGYLPEKAAAQFSSFAMAHRDEVVGYLATTWTTTPVSQMPAWPPIKNILSQWRGTNP